MTETLTPPEQEVRHGINPAASHVAFGAVDNEYLNPDKKRATDAHRDSLKGKRPEDLSYDAANAVSMDSRKKHYEGDGKSFDERNKIWNEKFWNGVTHAVNEDIDDATQDERLKAYQSLGLDTSDVTKEHDLYRQAEKFRTKYVDTEKSNIKQFVKDISEGCKNADGSVNLEQLNKRLTANKHLLMVFGKADDVHLLVKDFAIAHGTLSQTGDAKEHVVNETNQQISKPLNPSERTRLTALWKKQQELNRKNTRQENPPPPPPPEPPTPPRPDRKDERRTEPLQIETSLPPQPPEPPSPPEVPPPQGTHTQTKLETEAPIPPPEPPPSPEQPATEQEKRHSNIRIGGESIPGSRGGNEDAIWFDAKNGAAVLCDGVGGHGDGERASQSVVDSLKDSFGHLPSFTTLDEATMWFREQINLANTDLAARKKTTENPIASDAASTLSTCFVWESPEGKKILITGNLGDSRITVVRGNSLADMTIDQAAYYYHLVPHPEIPGEFLRYQGKAGVDYKKPRDVNEIQRIFYKFKTLEDPSILTGEEKALWDIRTKIVGAISGNSLDKDLELNSLELQPDDRVVLRSDGVTDVMTDQQTFSILQWYDDPQEAASALNGVAQHADHGPRAKGYADDKSVIVMDVMTDTQLNSEERPDGNIDDSPLTEEEIKLAIKSEKKPTAEVDFETIQSVIDKLMPQEDIARIIDQKGELQNRPNYKDKAVQLSDNELNAIEKLITESKEIREELVNKTPEYQKFEELLEARRKTPIGDFMEENNVIVDPNATTAYKDADETIKVPEVLHRLYILGQRIDSSTRNLREVRHHVWDGMNPLPFRQRIETLADFLSEYERQRGGESAKQLNG